MLATKEGLDLIKSSRNNLVLSHIFYADNILIFYTDMPSNIQSPKKVFHDYSVASGQIFNLAKFFIFYGSINDSQLGRIIANTGFSKGSLPFTYLGVLIFKGRAKSIHSTFIIDEILAKIPAWKGSLLSMEGIPTLVKSI